MIQRHQMEKALGKFCYLAKHLSLISVMSCLALLSDATEFDPEKKRVEKEMLVLWDYGRATASPNTIDPLKEEDITFLAEGPWSGVGVPKRFITENQWKMYEKLALNAGMILTPKFILAGNKRFKSASNHFLKIKELVKNNLTQEARKAFDESGEALESIKAFNGDSLIHISLFNQYIGDHDLIGEAPVQYEIRGHKMLFQESAILNIMHLLNVNPKKLPRKLANSPISLKLKIREHALENSDLFPTKAVFHQTWQRLSKNESIGYEPTIEHT